MSFEFFLLSSYHQDTIFEQLHKRSIYKRDWSEYSLTPGPQCSYVLILCRLFCVPMAIIHVHEYSLQTDGLEPSKLGAGFRAVSFTLTRGTGSSPSKCRLAMAMDDRLVPFNPSTLIFPHTVPFPCTTGSLHSSSHWALLVSTDQSSQPTW